MGERAKLRVWIIHDSEPLREVYGEAVGESHRSVRVLAWDEAEEWRSASGLPDSVALAGWDVLHMAGGCRPYLDGVARILILADVPAAELAMPLLDRPGVAVLYLPFKLEEFGLAMRWLAWETLEPEWNGAELAGAQMQAAGAGSGPRGPRVLPPRPESAFTVTAQRDATVGVRR